MADTKIYLGELDWQYITQFLLIPEFKKYVKAVEGKQLSTEDFSTVLKNKLESLDLGTYTTKDAIDEAINSKFAEVTGISFTKPEGGELPDSGQNGVIYLIPKTDGEAPDVYDEYYWDSTNNKFELFGSTKADMAGYLKNGDIREMTTDEVKAKWDAAWANS